ncbi:MAG TPA: alkaline phosphatase family protein [Actinomycetota bacterium]
MPLLFYGPGHVPEGVRVSRTATLADVAPTQAALLGFDFDAPDGEPLAEAVAGAERPPKLIVTMIWDSAGMNVLEEHPDAWPTLGRLIERGTFFEETFVGSSPSVTPAVHATIGTGAFPRNHGIVDLRFRVDGVPTAARGKAAANLLVPSLSDLFDVARDNEPVVGLIGSEGTLGMLGHGAFWESGDSDVAVTRTRTEWTLEGLNAEAFAFPEYAGGFPGLEEAIRRLDLEDGQADGRWLGEPMDEGVEGVSATPAFGEYQRSMVREVIEREGFGRDEVPDLLYVNFREIDAVGHRWGMHGPQMEAVVRSTDEALADLVRTLDREVGAGEWVLTMTADHGATPDPEPLGGFVIGPQEVKKDIEAEFGPIVGDLRVTQIWLELEEMAERGVSLQEVASFVADYRRSENASDPASLTAEQGEERVFGTVFPSAVLDDPPCIITTRSG